MLLESTTLTVTLALTYASTSPPKGTTTEAVESLSSVAVVTVTGIVVV